MGWYEVVLEIVFFFVSFFARILHKLGGSG